jgi:hypothetical protein
MIREITFQLVIKLVSEIFELLIPRLSKHIRDLLAIYLHDLYKKAKSTDNIFDDYAIELIARILNINLTEDKTEKREIKKEDNLEDQKNSQYENIV